MQQHQDITADGNKRHNRVKATEGYAKIEASCMQALRAGLPYIWIDTCCIDKSSSADLSEAINSMFHWYRISSICLVYLDDIEAPSLHEEGQRPLTEVKALLGRARWFTRGWTLQELIASQSIRFFDKDWTFLGTKGSLMTSLVDITGIDQVYLGGADLNNASIAMRMSWAARRVTTKIEDVAHSLFGIFNVNMPLLYGEGSKAFQRLQEEILKESDDQSLFAWQTHGANHKFLPDTLPIMLIHMGISVFAQHLNDFLQTADTISYAPSGEASMVGGKGLKIELPLFSMETGGPHRIVVLACTGLKGDHRRAAGLTGIVVQELCSSHFMRHPLAPLVRIKSGTIRDADSQSIYIRKLITINTPSPSPSYKSQSTRKVELE